MWGKREDMIVRDQPPFNAEPPAAVLAEGGVTALDAFYARNHGAFPDIPVEEWRLTVDGMVDKASELTYEELTTRFALTWWWRRSLVPVTGAPNCSKRARYQARTHGSMGQHRWPSGPARDLPMFSKPPGCTTMRTCTSPSPPRRGSGSSAGPAMWARSEHRGLVSLRCANGARQGPRPRFTLLPPSGCGRSWSA